MNYRITEGTSQLGWGESKNGDTIPFQEKWVMSPCFYVPDLTEAGDTYKEYMSPIC